MFDRPSAILARLTPTFVLVGLSLLLWFALESLIYRSGLYYRLAEPDSNTGATVNALMNLQRDYLAEGRNVLVLGDSRVGEGFSSKRARSVAPELNFINLAIPGSSPRTWYYLLREIDRAGYRYEAVVFGVVYQSPNLWRWDNWPLDVPHAAPLLGLGDTLSFPAGFESEEMRERARHAVLFPALAMQKDTLAALAQPWVRWKKLRVNRPIRMAAIPDYPGREETMPSLQFTRATGVQDWSDASAVQRTQIEDHLQQLANDDPALGVVNQSYFAHWLNASAVIAARRGVQLILFPLPRGPYAAMLPPDSDDVPVRRALASATNVKLLPTPAFHALEAPQFFFDTLHVNAAGRERMSIALSEQLGRLLDEEAP